MAMERVFGEHLRKMTPEDMDYEAMQNVFNLIKLRQWTRIDSYVEEYNETYFTELVITLKRKACQMTAVNRPIDPFHPSNSICNEN